VCMFVSMYVRHHHRTPTTLVMVMSDVIRVYQSISCDSNQSCHELSPYTDDPFLDGYCSTVQGLLDWFEVDLGFTELLFTQIDLCVMCVFIITVHRRPFRQPPRDSNCHVTDQQRVLPRREGPVFFCK